MLTKAQTGQRHALTKGAASSQVGAPRGPAFSQHQIYMQMTDPLIQNAPAPAEQGES